MSFQQLSLDKFAHTFAACTELSSVALGGQVVSVSDEFFAQAFHLLLVEPPPSLEGQFGPNGALYSGWESRRHNPAYDWCIIRLGTTGTIFGFDIDTSQFNGNEAPRVSVDILHASSSEQPPHADDPRWFQALPKVDIGPDSRHLFKIDESSPVNYVKLNMYPDGGIARFRVYGLVTPVFPPDESEMFDLAYVFAGGHVESASDQHFGLGSNLILPGRGNNIGDGWETKRSRGKDHKDWVIIKLGTAGVVDQVDIDTAHFKGNSPDSAEMHGICLDTDRQIHNVKDEEWTLILPRTKLGPHKQHYLQLENVEAQTYTHVKLTIYPDGGVQRVRVIGRKSNATKGVGSASHLALLSSEHASLAVRPIVLPVLPLTQEAFAPFGQVLQAYGDPSAAPKGMRITAANAGSASKFHKLALIESSYPTESGATTGISIYRCNPSTDIAEDGTLELKDLERHRLTNQMFIPMGWEESGDSGGKYVVVVAKNGEDDKPDLRTLKAFIASSIQGIVYGMAIWHQPMTVLGKVMDFACVETQIGNGSTDDCEIVRIENENLVLQLPVS